MNWHDEAKAWLSVAIQLALLVLVAALTWQVVTGGIQLQGFDFSQLLALLLALFAMGLAAAFYFRTTQTSNLFYDNSFKFTKEISETLGRIEERFGERLRHIDEGYSSLQNRLLAAENQAEGAAEEIASEKEELSRLAETRQALVEELLERARVTEGEKETIKQRLLETEQELDASRQQVRRLEHEYVLARARAEELRQASDQARASSDDVSVRFLRSFRIWVREQLRAGNLLDVSPQEAGDQLAKNLSDPSVAAELYRGAMAYGLVNADGGWSRIGWSEINRARSFERFRRNRRQGESDTGTDGA